jgi:lipopolysaccharide transport system permease protein
MPALLMTILTAIGAGLWLAALNVRFRDIQVVTPFLMQVLFFITPIVYPTSQIPAAWRWLYALNPLSTAVDSFRTCLLGSPGVTATAAALSSLVTLALMATGLWLFWETEDTFVDVV